MSTENDTDRSAHTFGIVDTDATNSKKDSKYADPRRPALYDQPAPKDVGKPGSHDLIVESIYGGIDGRLMRPVRADRSKILRLLSRDLEDRAELGLNRYGQTLQAGNGRDTLIDLYQENLDGLAYAKTLLDEEKDSEGETEIKALYDASLVLTLQTRRVLAIRNGEPIGGEPATPPAGA